MTRALLVSNEQATLRKGWCPGVLRPMQAKDGLLIRLRISAGTLSQPVLRALAQAGRDYGNGLFELSARANLQMRGIGAETYLQLVETLDKLGLVDADAAAEAVRNVLISPLAGLDGQLDVRETGKALEAMLVTRTDLHALPGKFGIVIDNGSVLSLANIGADVRFDWAGERNGQWFDVGIGGRACDATYLGRCEIHEIPILAARLASLLCDPPRRMQELMQIRGSQAIGREAGLSLAPARQRDAIEDPCPIGMLRPFENCFGAGATFGQLNANMLDALALAAEKFGGGEIRLTPWRAVIVPHVKVAQDAALRAYFKAHDFIVDRQDPRLAIAACGGMDACERGTTKTHTDALELMFVARQLRSAGIALHVSGCAKLCARHAATPYTLIARDSRYTLATDATAEKSYESNDAGLSLAEAKAMMETMVRKLPQKRELERP